MKINGEFVLREIAGETILIPVGQTALTMNGMITLDPVAALIWKKLEAESDETTILQAILDTFEVDEKTASADLQDFLGQMINAGLLQK